MSKEELNKLQNELIQLEGYISYLKTKKLSRGLTDYEHEVYDSKKEEFRLLSARLHNVKNEKSQKLVLINA